MIHSTGSKEPMKTIRLYTCCLCGEEIPAKDFQPAYPGHGMEPTPRYAHSACWQENSKLGHSLQTIPSRFTRVVPESELRMPYL